MANREASTRFEQLRLAREQKLKEANAALKIIMTFKNI